MGLAIMVARARGVAKRGELTKRIGQSCLGTGAQLDAPKKRPGDSVCEGLFASDSFALLHRRRTGKVTK